MTGSLFMMNVGDGLEIFFKIPSSPQIDGGKVALLDFGSSQGIGTALGGYWRGIQKTKRSPDVFILSHFHVDHYNGLFGKPPLSLSRVYFPIIPKIRENSIISDQFALALLSINYYIAYKVLGNGNIPIDQDFINLLQKLNHGSFISKPLSRGDTFTIGSLDFEVLWPPREITIEDAPAQRIIKALKAFWEAIDTEPQLRAIYRELRYSDRTFLKKLIESTEMKLHGEENELKIPTKYMDYSYLRVYEKMHPTVRKANAEIRRAANHLSLAFVSADNSILFLGDLESPEIRKLRQDIQDQEYCILITPHHGTHWDSTLFRVYPWHALSSVGPRLVRNVRIEFDHISNIHYKTFCSGDTQLLF